ncbi:type II secretion system F family protein [Paenarthrobacter sp. PH39-S1]|uniref:type II secretion system F family protein n=1 Tax=Paenarthrobacter sp. PH39-S1 TaxID=3046204 RepID=UPI0024BA4B1B|nr:type II secretion system F family protein [Paenarthrobacter sp. PH39-S1]MDJ0355160.1 type II secretion system F family protein [Paenarthrobacter sp. PH39-S1]
MTAWLWLAFALLGASNALLLPSTGSGRWRQLGAVRKRIGDSDTDGPGGGIANLPLMLELLATCLDAGLPLSRSLELLAAVTTTRTREGLATVVAGLSIGASWQTSWRPVRGHPQMGGLYEALTFAAVTGAPSATLLYAEAAQLRRSAQRESEHRAASLGVKLVIPLGLCSLPAFLCLGVVPVVVAMVPSFR